MQQLTIETSPFKEKGGDQQASSKTFSKGQEIQSTTCSTQRTLQQHKLNVLTTTNTATVVPEALCSVYAKGCIRIQTNTKLHLKTLVLVARLAPSHGSLQAFCERYSCRAPFQTHGLEQSLSLYRGWGSGGGGKC